MAALTLFTGYALLALIALAGALIAHVEAKNVRRSAMKLEELRGRLIVQEQVVDAIDKRLKSLAGRVYQRERPPRNIEGELADEPAPTTEEQRAKIRDRLRAEHGLGTVSGRNGARE